jgi:electron transport complex protein RnfG
MTRIHTVGPWFLPLTVMVAPAFAVDYLSVEQAQGLLMPGADRFVEQPVHLRSEQRDAIRERAGVRQRNDTQMVWRGEHEGQFLGWFILDEVIGKHEFITYAAAISPQGSVLGIEILSYRETHGGQVREESWRANLEGKTLADPLRLGQDIPNISGATLSCRNLVDGVRRLLVLHDMVLKHE